LYETLILQLLNKYFLGVIYIEGNENRPQKRVVRIAFYVDGETLSPSLFFSDLDILLQFLFEFKVNKSKNISNWYKILCSLNIFD
jgi:hypothetical protein